MRAGVKLAGFAVVLAAAFGAGAALGAAVPEVYTDDDATGVADEPAGHHGVESPGHAEEGER